MTAETEHFLADYPPDVGDVARVLIETIRGQVPEAVERVYHGWKGIGFTHPAAGYLCAVFLEEDRVRVGFEHGNLLYDPDRLLEGSGKQVRYLPVAEVTDERLAVLVDFVEQALDLR